MKEKNIFYCLSPLTIVEIEEYYQETGSLEIIGIVPMFCVSDSTTSEEMSFEEYLSMKMTGTTALLDVRYERLGKSGAVDFYKVTGNLSILLEDVMYPL